jgi:hypothetical protein
MMPWAMSITSIPRGDEEYRPYPVTLTNWPCEELITKMSVMLPPEHFTMDTFLALADRIYKFCSEEFVLL